MLLCASTLAAVLFRCDSDSGKDFFQRRNTAHSAVFDLYINAAVSSQCPNRSLNREASIEDP